MLKVRVIPTLLFKDFGLVKSKHFESCRRVGSIIPAVRVYGLRDVDELVLLDISDQRYENGPDLDGLELDTLVSDCRVPLSVGGGVFSLDHASKLINSGADKVVINTALFAFPELISKVAAKFGKQAVVAGIDAKQVGKSKWCCYSHSGSVNTSVDPIHMARTLESLGAGEILLTSVNFDGMMCGYDLDLIEAVTSAVSIPVIASGGAGNYKHMVEAVKVGGASAVAASSMFIFTECTPHESKCYMRDHGIPVRLT